MTPFSIGDWIRREGSTDQGGDDDQAKWHLCESIINGEAITRCGRSMAAVVDTHALEVSETKPLTRLPDQPQLCKAGCDR